MALLWDKKKNSRRRLDYRLKFAPILNFKPDKKKHFVWVFKYLKYKNVFFSKSKKNTFKNFLKSRVEQIKKEKTRKTFKYNKKVRKCK